MTAFMILPAQFLTTTVSTRVCSMVSRLMLTPVYENNSIAVLTLFIVIIYSRSVVFISTFSSMKSELFLKKGGVILSYR